MPFRNITPRGSKIAWVLCGVLSVALWVIPDPETDERFLPWDQHKKPDSAAARIAARRVQAMKEASTGGALPTMHGSSGPASFGPQPPPS